MVTLIPPHVTLLPYHPQSLQVLDGIYRGLPVKMAERLESCHLMASSPRCRLSTQTVTVRPWWRLFRATPAVQITVGDAQ